MLAMHVDGWMDGVYTFTQSVYSHKKERAFCENYMNYTQWLSLPVHFVNISIGKRSAFMYFVQLVNVHERRGKIRSFLKCFQLCFDNGN